MNDELLAAIKEAVESAVNIQINGKLVDIKKQLTEQGEKLDTHGKKLDDMTPTLEGITPILQATAGGKFLYKIFISIGSIAIAWISLKQTFNL